MITENRSTNIITKFLESKIFILIIGLLTMLCWYINSLYVTASIFGITLILELIFKSKLYSFPAMLGLVFAGYKKYSMSFKDYGLYVMIGILLFAIILFIIRFIQNRHYIKQRIKGCSILYTTLLLAIPMLVSIINSPVKPITLAHTALWVLNAVIVLAVLYGIPNTKEAKEKVCSRVRDSFPEYFDDLKYIGYYVHEFSSERFCASWNKAYALHDIDKRTGRREFNFTLAGIPARRGANALWLMWRVMMMCFSGATGSGRSKRTDISLK